MQTFLAIIHVLVSVFMILVILLQAGKSGGIGGLGGGGSATVFGGRGSQTFLGKLTTGCAAVFMITSLSLAWLSSRSDSVVLQRARAGEQQTGEQKPAEPAVDPKAPVAPAPGSPESAQPTPDTPPSAPAPAPGGESK